MLESAYMSEYITDECIHMYIDMCIYIYIKRYVYIDIQHIHIHIYIYTDKCIHTIHVHVHMFIHIYMCIHICVVACGKNGSGLHGIQYTISYYLRGQFTCISYTCINMYVYIYMYCVYLYIYTFSSLKFSINIHYIFCILHYALRSICCVIQKRFYTTCTEKLYYVLCTVY